MSQLRINRLAQYHTSPSFYCISQTCLFCLHTHRCFVNNIVSTNRPAILTLPSTDLKPYTVKSHPPDAGTTSPPNSTRQELHDILPYPPTQQARQYQQLPHVRKDRQVLKHTHAQHQVHQPQVHLLTQWQPPPSILTRHPCSADPRSPNGASDTSSSMEHRIQTLVWSTDPPQSQKTFQKHQNTFQKPTTMRGTNSTPKQQKSHNSSHQTEGLLESSKTIQPQTPTSLYTSQHYNILRLQAGTAANRPHQQRVRHRPRYVKMYEQHKNIEIPKKNQSHKYKHIYTDLKSGSWSNLHTRGSRHRGNPKHNRMPPPKNTHNRKHRTLAAAIPKTIRTRPPVSPKHQYSLPPFSTPIPSPPSHKFISLSLANSALSRLENSLHVAPIATYVHWWVRNGCWSTPTSDALLGDNSNLWSTCTTSGRSLPIADGADFEPHRIETPTPRQQSTGNGRRRAALWRSPEPRRLPETSDWATASPRSRSRAIHSSPPDRDQQSAHTTRSSGGRDREDKCTTNKHRHNNSPRQLNQADTNRRENVSTNTETQLFKPLNTCTYRYRHENSRNQRPGDVCTTHRRKNKLPNTAGHPGICNSSRRPIYTTSTALETNLPTTTESPASFNGHASNTHLIPGTSVSYLLQTATRLQCIIPAIKLTTVCRFSFQLPYTTTLVQQPLHTQHSSPNQQLIGNIFSSKPPSFPILFNLNLFYKLHNNPSTLSNKSNPLHAWETYAPRRVHAFISKNLALQTKCALNILRIIKLPNPQTTSNTKYPSFSIFVYSNYTCLQLTPRVMTGATKPHTRHHNSNTADIFMEDVTPPKRTSPNPIKASHKKSKSIGTTVSLYRDPSQMEFWYGFPIMETIAYEAGIPPFSTTTPTEELIASGYVASEAVELRSAIMSFPRVQQKLWPTTRPDGIEGQHINITQLPFDIEVNPKTSLSLDYHILLHFEKPTTPFSQDQVMKKLLMRFQAMEIHLGDLIGEPIAVLCHGPKTARVWSGMAKVHLKHPSKDGIALLSGKRIFAITLDNDALTIAKVAKTYDPLAPSNLLTVKINTDNIRELVAHQLFKTVVEESFKRGHEFELAQVQKSAGETFGWLITTSPEQVEKISRHKIPILGELLTPVVSSSDQLSRDEVIRRNCLVLLAKGLNLNKLIEPTTASLHAHFGTKNIVSVFYPRATTKIHHGVANVECLNSAVYKQHVNKSARLLNKWVTFHPHPNSLNGSAKPDDATLKKLGFTDVNNALADTIEALKNAPGPSQPPLNKSDIATLVKDVVSKENDKLRTEFKTDLTLLRTDLSTEAKIYADQINLDLRGALTNLEQVLGQSMQVVKNLVRPALPPTDSTSPRPN